MDLEPVQQFKRARHRFCVGCASHLKFAQVLHEGLTFLLGQSAGVFQQMGVPAAVVALPDVGKVKFCFGDHAVPVEQKTFGSGWMPVRGSYFHNTLSKAHNRDRTDFSRPIGRQTLTFIANADKTAGSDKKPR